MLGPSLISLQNIILVPASMKKRKKWIMNEASRIKHEAYQKMYYEKNKDKLKKYAKKQADIPTNKTKVRSAALLKKFNITIEDYNKMFTNQGGHCKICN